MRRCRRRHARVARLQRERRHEPLGGFGETGRPHRPLSELRDSVQPCSRPISERGLYALGATGVTAAVTLFALGASHAKSPTSHWWFWLGLGLIGFFLLCGVAAASNQVLGWPPLDWLSHELRQETKRAKQDAERREVATFNQSVDAVLAELRERQRMILRGSAASEFLRRQRYLSTRLRTARARIDG